MNVSNLKVEPNLHLEVPARCRSASSCFQHLHSDTGAPVHEERVIAIQEKPNLHLELYLRLASVWKHTARLRVKVWINCVTHEIVFNGHASSMKDTDHDACGKTF